MSRRTPRCVVGLCCALLLSSAAAAAQESRPGVEDDHAAMRQPRTDVHGHRADAVGLSAAPVPPGVRAQDATEVAWASLGPPGGDVTDVAASTTAHNVVLAGIAPQGGSGGGLYRSTDGGATWSEVPALAGSSVYDIEFTAGGKAWLATESGVRASVDDGLSWTAHDLGIGPNQTVYDVGLDPGSPTTLWVTIADSFGFQPINVMRSTDDGATWVNRTPRGRPIISGTGIAVDPTDSDTVIAIFGGSFGGGQVWVTTDGGATWSNRSAGLPANPMRTVVYDGERLLVGGGLLFGSQYVGLYQSTNLGRSWKSLHNNSRHWPLLVVEDIAVAPGDPQTILVATNGAGVNRSTDGGRTWQSGIGGTATLSVQSLRFRPGSASRLLLGASSLGVFRSRDGGARFVQSSDGISELNLFSIHANPLDPDEIAVTFQGSNNGGVITTTDGGAGWNFEPVPPTRYSKVRFTPDGTLYAISSGPSSVAPEGLYRREGDGSWTALGPDQGTFYESDLAAIRFSIADPGLILLGGADFGVAGFEATVWRSPDGGQSWSKQYEAGEFEFVTDLEIVEDGLDRTMIASYNGFNAPQAGGLLRSVDGGASWSPSLAGLPAFMREARLCASPGDPWTFYMSAWLDFSNGSVFRTTDGGASWASTGWTGDPIADIACDPADDQVLYIAQLGEQRVARSQDQGAVFAPFADGLESAGTPRTLVHGGIRLLLAGSRGSHVANLGGE